MKKQIVTGVICGGIGLLAGYRLMGKMIMKELNSDNFKHEIDKQFKERFVKNDFSKNLLNDIVFETRTDAMEAIDKLGEFVKSYGNVSVADLYDISGLVSTFRHHKYGWTDVSSAEVVFNKYGYIIKIDEPKILK